MMKKIDMQKRLWKANSKESFITTKVRVIFGVWIKMMMGFFFYIASTFSIIGNGNEFKSHFNKLII